MRPNLNQQCDSNVFTLFRNGIISFIYSTILINWFVFCFLIWLLLIFVKPFALSADLTKNHSVMIGLMKDKLI